MKWSGSTEKKWDWYKHTKPCYNLIYLGICKDTNCNYAHTVEQYVDAISKRKFKLDFNIVNQLKRVTFNSTPPKMELDEDEPMDEPSNQPSLKRRRTDY